MMNFVLRLGFKPNMKFIKNLNQLLKMDLEIPNFQRPYKWGVKNVLELLTDIETAINDYELYSCDFTYRIGTVILYKTENYRYAIVDGQQRIISLVLLRLCLEESFHCSILQHEFQSKITISNIQNNANFINEWFSLKGDDIKKKFLDAFDIILEVVVICVNKVSEAFQLFDSQNTRGKSLVPHDLLKAYHLREMKDNPYEMEHAVTKWEAQNTESIRELFETYLFPILNWSQKEKSRTFSVKDIDTYKGIHELSRYTYANRASKAMPYFQITESFISGHDFFEMVEHYLQMINDIKREVSNNSKFSLINKMLSDNNKSTGYSYAKELFYCALLCYYDRFHNFDEMVVKKLFTWAFMVRVDMQILGYDTINKYAIGETNNNSKTTYSNNIPIFSKIRSARLHTEIASLQIKVKRNPDCPAYEKWGDLYIVLKNMNGV